MTESQHTPGRLIPLQGYKNKLTDETNLDAVITVAARMDSPEAITERLAACWNACEGIANPEAYDGLLSWAEKMLKWLDGQATRDESKAKTERFKTLADAYRADARNFRIMQREGNEALAALLKAGVK